MRWSVVLLASLCGCTAARMQRAHGNAAAALECPKGHTLLFQDDNGYQALGCGAIARCASAESCERVSKASCRAVAEFQDQLCLAVAAQPRQGMIIDQWADRTRDENVCEERYRAQVTMCPPGVVTAVGSVTPLPPSGHPPP